MEKGQIQHAAAEDTAASIGHIHGQAPSTYSFECVCGQVVRTIVRDGTCPHCGGLYSLDWLAD